MHDSCHMLKGDSKHLLTTHQRHHHCQSVKRPVLMVRQTKQNLITTIGARGASNGSNISSTNSLSVHWLVVQHSGDHSETIDTLPNSLRNSSSSSNSRRASHQDVQDLENQVHMYPHLPVPTQYLQRHLYEIQQAQCRLRWLVVSNTSFEQSVRRLPESTRRAGSHRVYGEVKGRCCGR